ncbi:MAG: hypothetical protein IPM79_38200 [Polyangiaceae bacterium]|nr:hypothetical protein [Polyangiaceae bacterium]
MTRGPRVHPVRAVDARRAFPCFDEPSFKTPFEVTSSCPGERRHLQRSSGEDHVRGGSTRVAFAATPRCRRT